MNLRRVAAISLGGMAGASVRWAVLQAMPVSPGSLPWSVLAINVVGSVLLGVALAEQWSHPRWGLVAHDAVGIGFCGGLTTFSTFAVEVAQLGRTGHTSEAVLYIVLSVVLAVAGAFAGALTFRHARALLLPVEGEDGIDG